MKIEPLRCLAAAVPVLLCASSCKPATDGELELALQRGRNAEVLGRSDWARYYYQQVLELKAGNLDALRGLARTWISGFEGSASRSIEALEQVLSIAPDDQEARRELIGALVLLGESQRVREELQLLDDTPASLRLRASVLEPTDPEAAIALFENLDEEVDVERCRAYQRLAQFEPAETCARRALEEDPFEAELHYLLASIQRTQGRLDEAAERLDLHQAARELVAPDSKLSPAEKLQRLRLLGSLDHPSAVLRARLIGALWENRLDPPEGAIDRLIESERIAASDLYELAQEAQRLGRGASARKLLERTVEVQPDHLGALTLLASEALETGRLSEAANWLARSDEAQAHYGPTEHIRGQLLLRQGDESSAERALLRAVELVPWEHRIRIDLANLYLAQGRREELETLIENAPTSTPELEQYAERHL